MNNKLTIAVALAAGLAGGMLTRFIAPPPVFAQAFQTPGPQPPAAQTPAAQTPTDEIRAKSFVLVDQANRAVGTFTVDPDFAGGARVGRGMGQVVLKDANGKVVWRAGGTMLRPLNATVR